MYSPKIREKYVRAMYQIKQEIGLSITEQANSAIEKYLKTKKERDNGIKGSLSGKA